MFNDLTLKQVTTFVSLILMVAVSPTLPAVPPELLNGFLLAQRAGTPLLISPFVFLVVLFTDDDISRNMA